MNYTDLLENFMQYYRLLKTREEKDSLCLIHKVFCRLSEQRSLSLRRVTIDNFCVPYGAEYIKYDFTIISFSPRIITMVINKIVDMLDSYEHIEFSYSKVESYKEKDYFCEITIFYRV